MESKKMSPSLEFISHTADIRLKATEETLPKLFITCLKGMNELLKPGMCDQKKIPDITETIHIEASDSTILLVDFLSEILTHSNLNKAVYCDCLFEKMSDHELIAIMEGQKVDGFGNDIKAVTYHEADVRLNEQGDFETIIVFDI
jgi:SHS2 domain-containing protein